MRKRAISLVFIMVFLSLNLISAINLDVKSNPISNMVITDLEEPAVFELTITNLEQTDSFEIYSLVGVDISPKTFSIESNKTKTIAINVMPQKSIQSDKGFFTFEYMIKNSKNENQEETLTINIVDLGMAFSIIPQNINPNSEEIIISIENKANLDFNNLKIQMNSAFFEFEDTLEIKSKEKKELEVKIDKEKLKSIEEGSYLLNIIMETNGKIGQSESIIKFIGQENIETTEIREGILINRYEITNKNLGNIRKTIIIREEKNLFSYLFTTVNIAPTKTELNGFNKVYIWEKEVIPNQELKIIIKTNWFYPIIVILLAIGLFILIKKSMERDLILRKKVSFVKTKGGQFALKINLRLKAKKFIERINIIDKLPPLVKLYERYGAIPPSKVDLENRRLEYNIEKLNKDEERIFTYIIYSKIGVVGKFELPEAKAIYEKQGKIKRTESNRSFFINEPKE